MFRASCCAVLLISACSVALAQAPLVTGVSSAASGDTTISSGSWVAVYGANLSATSRAWQSSDFNGSSLPTALDGVSVTINGKKAAIAYVSPTQLNVISPTDSTTGSVQVQVANAAGSATGKVTLADYAPALFPVQAKYAAARHNTDAVYVTPAGFLGTNVNSRPAQPGEIIQLYGTGFGATTPAIPADQLAATPAPLADLSKLKITIGGADSVIQYAGLVSPGLYQINVIVPLAVDGDQPIVATIGTANSQSGLALPVSNAGRAAVAVSLTPGGRTIRCSTTLPLTIAVSNTLDKSIVWQINGVVGGSSAVGTISADNAYTAPDVLPASAAVTITAISHFDRSIQASINVALQNPLPVVTAVSPNPISPGANTITITGSGFAPTSTVTVAGIVVPNTFVNPTQLALKATIPMPVGRLAAIKVANPNPGAATSTPLALPVRPAAEKVPYASAVRFLEMASWGASPQNVADLQALGTDAWLTAQFAKTASKWPDPNTTTEGVARLQTALWNIALTGDDQLRQRVAFALSQIVVVSSVKDIYHQQMVAWQRLLGDYAFGSYRDVLTAVSLNPAMGDYLDMVNNDKANAAAGTVANENYARELMQLFSLGTVQLDAQGNPVPSSDGTPLPEYDQTTVAEMAKVMTGWTYAPTPGFGSLWKNMTYYFSPMTAFPEHHDTTQKNLNLPIPCTIPAGGTADSDLSAALDCLMKQSNVAPFVSYRLIQRFVMSDPPPAYAGRVAQVFKSSQGNLKQVISAMLTDPEAVNAGTGKLSEPILFAAGVLRALNATITAPDALTAQANSMGENPLSAGTVFNYFMPDYRIAAMTPPPVAPEFQLMNDATALARANFAYRVATNGISGGIVVDINNLIDLANTPADLVEAVNQALFRSEMEPAVRSILTTAANGSTNMTTRVRSVLYAAIASPQYQVKR